MSFQVKQTTQRFTDLKHSDKEKATKTRPSKQTSLKRGVHSHMKI